MRSAACASAGALLILRALGSSWLWCLLLVTLCATYSAHLSAARCVCVLYASSSFARAVYRATPIALTASPRRERAEVQEGETLVAEREKDTPGVERERERERERQRVARQEEAARAEAWSAWAQRAPEKSRWAHRDGFAPPAPEVAPVAADVGRSSLPTSHAAERHRAERARADAAAAALDAARSLAASALRLSGAAAAAAAGDAPALLRALGAEAPRALDAASLLRALRKATVAAHPDRLPSTAPLHRRAAALETTQLLQSCKLAIELVQSQNVAAAAEAAASAAEAFEADTRRAQAQAQAASDAQASEARRIRRARRPAPAPVAAMGLQPQDVEPAAPRRTVRRPVYRMDID
jgi:hypothetical protein